MKRTELLCGIAVAALTFSANAATRYWDGGANTREWDNVLNWDGDTTLPSNGDTLILQSTALNKSPLFDGTGGPSNAERLVIESGITMTISGAQFAISGVSGSPVELDIASTAKMIVTADGGELRLNAVNGKSDISGVIEFENLSKMEVPQNFDLSGSGSVTFDGTVTVEISDTKKLLHDLDSGFSIDSGVTTINALSGTVDFENKDGVTAQAGGDLALSADVKLQSSAGNWTADGSGSKITFNRENLSLSGDFILSNSASFDFVKTVHTSGDLMCNSGDIVVDSFNNEIFRFNNGTTDVDVDTTCNCSSGTVCPS